MALKKHDFIEVDYTGKIKDTGDIFDTTYIEVAKKNEIYEADRVTGPVTICLGEGLILPGLEKKLEGKEIGEYDLELTAEEGFGKKSAKLIQLIPTAKFKKQEVMPVPGLQISVDGMMGTIKTVSGGRTIVDFNHPLSGKVVLYHIRVLKVVTDQKEKARSVLKMFFQLVPKTLEMEGDALKLEFAGSIPKPFREEAEKRLKDLAQIVKVEWLEERKTPIPPKQ